jgi:hypothetical protein
MKLVAIWRDKKRERQAKARIYIPPLYCRCVVGVRRVEMGKGLSQWVCFV